MGDAVPPGHVPWTDLVGSLLAWHDPDVRRLAWRRSTDPYAVLVSEIMAQQTQAERAAVAWTAFMDTFPTPRALAEASSADVIAAWKGLGYNRRAINLQRCAVQIVADHGGRVPCDLDALLALPGIGPYTARAVQAFAFGHPVVPVDTNVARVLARLSGRVLARPAAQSLAAEMVEASLDDAMAGSALAAALMDLGARVCTARSPSCDVCPLAPHCDWEGGTGPDPAAAGAYRPRPQGRFDGSARQARGRVVDALRSGSVSTAEAVALSGAHGEALLDDLVVDGLAARIDGGFALPGWPGRIRSHDDAGNAG